MLTEYIHVYEKDVKRLDKLLYEQDFEHFKHPILFHDVDGNTFAIIHGVIRPDGSIRYIGGYNTDWIYLFALIYDKSMEFGDTLNVLSCYGGKNPDHKHPYVDVSNAQYKISFRMEGDYLIMWSPENDEEDKFIETYKTMYNMFMTKG